MLDRKRNNLSRGVAIMLALVLSGCTSTPISVAPQPGHTSSTREMLMELPAPRQKVVVAVFNYPDLTGQYRPSETVTTYSRAVSQGGGSILVRALQDAGRGRWFTVLEREALQNLLTERQIIRETRAQYAGPDGQQLPPPPPLLYAGVLLAGGVIGYDSNTLTGGLGARYFGIGGNTEYRQDTVTVYLRAVSTQTGEILGSVTAQKTLLSLAISANVFRFIDVQRLFEFEAGLSINEPGLMALEQAIELAVYELVMEGALAGVWSFADDRAGQEALRTYRAEYRAETGAGANAGPAADRRAPAANGNRVQSPTGRAVQGGRQEVAP